MADPLQQFEVQTLIPLEIAGYDVSFTNASLFMVLSALVVTFIMGFGVRKRTLVPSKMQSVAELSYEFIATTIKDTVGNNGRAFFPFIFTLFMFVLFCNLLGMIPYTFTVTSHIAVTFALALFLFLGVTLVGFAKHGLGYLKLFVPSGLSTGMMLSIGWLIVVIEVFSYLACPVSLSIRLAANMTAGHILLKVIAGFVAAMGVFGVFPIVFMSLLVGFEIFVAILQAYIFTVLTCVYLNDAINMH